MGSCHRRLVSGSYGKVPNSRQTGSTSAIRTLHLRLLPWIATIVATLLFAIPAPGRGAVQLLIPEMRPYAEVVLFARVKEVSSLIDLDLEIYSDANKHDFLPQEPLGTCLVSHVFCALRAARLGDWDIISVP